VFEQWHKDNCRGRKVVRVIGRERDEFRRPAHDATFYVPLAGIVRFDFSDPRARGYVRSRDGTLDRVRPETRLFLSAGRYVLSLYDPKVRTRVSIVFEPD
jgi:hypothetical protein